MKNEFNPGEFCRFPNEEIPRILDILRANGHPVWKDTAAYQSHHDIVYCSWDGDMMGYKSTEPECTTEFSRHDFLVIALRLEEGMGMRSDTSTPDQRAHISSEMEKVGIKIGMSIKLYSAERNSIIMLKYELAVCSKKVPVDTPYLDWCKRLCVEPIGLSSQDVMNEVLPDSHPMKEVEPVFDPSKPFEINDEGRWHYNGSAHFVGFNIQKNPVIQIEGGGYFAYNGIRNIPGFNASMLEVGEWMEITEIGPYENLVVQKMSNGYFYCNEYAEVISNDTLKGRRVNVEIKIVE